MRKTSTVQSLAHELYSYLARRFPICCSSDEFVFFPQAIEINKDWSNWDDLSPDSVSDSVEYLKRFRGQLLVLQGVDRGIGKDEEGPYVSVLKWITHTLEEQFTLVRTHTTQPTFALSVATVGLVQALQSGEEKAWVQRLGTLPRFLEKAFDSLSSVPELYRDLGIEMAEGFGKWLLSFGTGASISAAGAAVERYATRLSHLCVTGDFHLEPDLLNKVVTDHTGNFFDFKEALWELQEETASVTKQLEREANKLGHGTNWQSAYSAILWESVLENGKKGLLRDEIDRLRHYCVRNGLMDLKQAEFDRLNIEFLPSSLVSIRSADSYNAIPGYPFKGGVFYIFDGGSLGISPSAVHPVYRMTAAHESYPGHHLLDLYRWNNPNAVLRPIEYPLFYEGWACFGEDLMMGIGAFDRPYDRLILLRRRLRHAVRGRVDLLLHAAEMGFDEATAELVNAGFEKSRAFETVRKYALRPAYQMCYTVGRRRFQRLFDSYGQDDVAKFVSVVLANGELLFEDLERILEQSIRNGEAEKRGNGEGNS